MQKNKDGQALDRMLHPNNCYKSIFLLRYKHDDFSCMVKELRERTGAGMMECKKALTESSGDIDLAIEQMRKTGLAKADKKAGRMAAEGRIAIEQTDSMPSPCWK